MKNLIQLKKVTLCTFVLSSLFVLSCKKTNTDSLSDSPYFTTQGINITSSFTTTPVYNPDLPVKATIYTSHTITLSTLNVDEASKHINNATQINNAINSVSSQGGGTVVLNAGIYRITGHIILKDNVRLKGVDIATSIIKRDESFTPNYANGSNLVGTDGVISDITISDLTIDGNTPSSTRMSTFFNMYGMRITCDDYPGQANQRVYVTNIKVVNCGMGVHIKHSDDVIVKGCDIEGNGTKGDTLAHPLPYYFHNLYIRNINRAQVYGNNLLINSPSGNGLNVTDITNLTVDGNIVSGNNYRGVRIGGSSSVVLVQNNTLNDNNNFGLGTATDGGSPTQFSFTNNTLNSNRGYAIDIGSGSSYGQIQGNSLSSNTPTNLVHLATGLSHIDSQ